MKTEAISFIVHGIPAPGGSKRSFRHAKTGRVVVLEDCRRNKSWREVCAATAIRAQAGRPPFDGPLEVEFRFQLPRPKGHFGTGRNRSVVRASAPAFPAVKPDTTKLVRAVEDALTGILWRDDALIVKQSASKSYTDQAPGVWVCVRLADGPAGGGA